MALHRYWRVYITESNSGPDNFIRLYEVELRGSVGGADQCNGGTASASHNTSTAYKLFNNNEAGDYWINGGPSAPCWFQYDFGYGNAVSVAELRILNGSSNTQSPKAFSLQWSDDGSNFITTSSWLNITGWIGGVEKLFAITASSYEPTKQSAIFPSLPGLSWELKKNPEFRTSIHTALSGREQRGAFRAYPIWWFNLLFDWLRVGNPNYEYENLQGFILGRRGSFESFLFLDPTDSVCTNMPFGVGDGVQTVFQLTRAFGFHGSFSFTEPVENIKTLTDIRLNGAIITAYAISETGLVTFTVPPAAESVLTWSGEFYFRCRFGKDTSDFARILPNLWELRELTFVGAPGNKI